MSEPLVRAAQFLVERHAEPLSLRDVADHAGYSPFHLSRRFADFVGSSPMQYLAAVRFQRAKTLLLSDTDSVLDICHEVGFSSIGTFSRRFNDEVGISPSRFRRLPEMLAGRDVQAGQRQAGPRNGGVITGRVRYAPQIVSAMGDGASTYVGLFPSRAPRGIPVVGMLVRGEAEFRLEHVPRGQYFLLCNSRPHPGDPLQQVLPPVAYVGGHPYPVDLQPGMQLEVDIELHEAFSWATPVTIALPALTLDGPQRGSRPA